MMSTEKICAWVRRVCWNARNSLLGVCRTGDIAREAARGIGLPYDETGPGIWSIWGARVHGFQVRLDLFSEDESLVCMTRADIRIHRPWIPQKLAVLLLEENNRYRYGSNRLLEGTGGMSVVHCHVCETRLFTSRNVANVSRILIRQMEQLVARLYAEDLVIPTPEGDRVLDLG